MNKEKTVSVFITTALFVLLFMGCRAEDLSGTWSAFVDNGYLELEQIIDEDGRITKFTAYGTDSERKIVFDFTSDERELQWFLKGNELTILEGSNTPRINVFNVSYNNDVITYTKSDGEEISWHKIKTDKMNEE